MDIKPIETVYKGYRFRSRTEARWAVFFDHLGWKWEYEQEGFDLGDGVWYLPDFYFPDLNLYAEVKADNFTKSDLGKPIKLAEHRCIIFLPGQPDYRSYPMFNDINTNPDNTLDVVMVPTNNEYYPLYYTYDFDQEYFPDVTVAINAARSARF